MHDDVADDMLMPTYGNIGHQLLQAFPQRAKGADTVLIGFCGHGVEREGRTVLMPRDVHLSMAERMGIPLQDFRDCMAACEAKQQVLLLDACHSGAGRDAEEMSEQMREEIAGSEGMVILASCGVRERSYEWQAKRHGVFSHFVIEGLRGKAAGAAGEVTAFALCNYVSTQVKRWSVSQQSSQTPWSTMHVTGDIVLVSGARPGPPAPPPPPQVQWHYMAGADQRGPVDEAGLRAAIESGDLARSGLVWSAGMSGWTPVGEVPDLARLFPAEPPAPAPSPPPPPSQPKVTFESNPSGADVLIDGRRRGRTPFELLLDPGEYAVRLELEGHKPKAGKLRVQAGKAARVKLALEPDVRIIKIDPDKIGTVTGPSGKTIRKLQEETGTRIEIEDDGTVLISSSDLDKAQEAQRRIEYMTEDVQAGRIYEGKVVSIKDFGAFVEILPGKDGLLHISEMSDDYVDRVGDVVKIGDVVKVKALEVDPQGKVRLSRKGLGGGAAEDDQD